MNSSTLGVHVDRYVDTKYNPETRTWYAKYLYPMAEMIGSDRTLESIGRVDAERYWQALQARRTCWADHPTKPVERRPLSITTLHNHLRAVRTFWNEMVRQRLVEMNPFDHLTCPRDTRPVEMKAIAVEDLRAIWSAAKRSGVRDFAIITVMSTVGLRAGELVSMTVSKLDMKHGTAWVFGKRGWRKIFLGKASQEAIRDYLSVRPINAPDALWLNVQGHPLTDDGVRQLVKRLAAQANVRGKHNLHAFRHRAAQAWLDKGINAEVVAQALGHANVTVTLAIYGNQDDERVKKTVLEFELSPFDELA